MPPYHLVEIFGDQILAACRELVAAGIYPGGDRLRKYFPDHHSQTLIKYRRRFVASGDLDLTSVGGERSQVGGRPRRQEEISDTRRAVLEAMRAIVARGEYPNNEQVAALLQRDPHTIRDHKRMLIMEGRLVIPAGLVRKPKKSPSSPGVLAVTELEERMSKIRATSLDEKRIGRNKMRAMARGALSGLAEPPLPVKRDRGPLAGAIKDYDHAMRRIRGTKGGSG